MIVAICVLAWVACAAVASAIIFASLYGDTSLRRKDKAEMWSVALVGCMIGGPLALAMAMIGSAAHWVSKFVERFFPDGD